MKQVSDKITRYQIDGMLFPTNPNSNIPIFIEVNGEVILPIFTTVDKFKDAALWGGFLFANANIIINPQDFQDCVFLLKEKFHFHVAIDPYVTEDGNTRFDLVRWDEK